MITDLSVNEIVQISGGNNRAREVSDGMFCLLLGVVCYSLSFLLGTKIGKGVETAGYGFGLLGLGFLIPGNE